MAAVDAGNPGARADVRGRFGLIMMDDVSGAILTLAATRGARQFALDRVVVFLADGVTLWFDARFGSLAQAPELSWSAEGSALRVRLSAHTADELGAVEHLSGQVESCRFRVPLTVNLALEPTSRPVSPSRALSGESLAGSESYRALGTFAAGSVLYPVSGQAWRIPDRLVTYHDAGHVCLQASFQDGSALLAVRPNGCGGAPGEAALQLRAFTATAPVSAIVVDGAPRRPPRRMICQLDGRSAVTVVGAQRNVDQHLALVHSGGDRVRWVRQAFTPFDFVRSGVTGFGILEQIDSVSTPVALAGADNDLPDPY